MSAIYRPVGQPDELRDAQRVLCGRGLGLLLAGCLAFSLGVASSVSLGTMGATFDLFSVERRAEIVAELPNSYARLAPVEKPVVGEGEGEGKSEGEGAAAVSDVERQSVGSSTAVVVPAPAHGLAGVTAPGSPSANPNGSPNGKCFVLIDRHNHKTGGTTMRDIMLQNARYGDCHYWGYGQDEPHWSKWLTEAHNALPQIGLDPNAPPLKLCLEAHFPVFGFMDTRVKKIAALRTAARAPMGSSASGCTVLLTTRVREPLSFYLSYFKWDIAGRQAKGETEVYGKSFLEWYPPDLQSNAMWNAFSTEFASRFYDNRYPHRWLNALKMSNQTFAKLCAALDLFDIVGTVEQFDASLLLANDLIGGNQPGGGLSRIQYLRTQPVHRHRDVKLPPIKSEEICPDMAACAAHIRKIAPRDHLLYDRYAATFQEWISSLGEPFAARVRAFKKVGTKPWVGGPDPESVEPVKCAWQADTVEETFDSKDNPCVPNTPKLGWLADRCMGVTNKNLEMCCVRFQPLTTPLARQADGELMGHQHAEWHSVWARHVCKQRGGKCTALGAKLAKDAQTNPTRSHTTDPPIARYHQSPRALGAPASVGRSPGTESASAHRQLSLLHPRLGNSIDAADHAIDPGSHEKSAGASRRLGPAGSDFASRPCLYSQEALGDFTADDDDRVELSEDE